MAKTKYSVINSVEGIEKIIDSAFETNEEFFGLSLKPKTIFIANTREEYNKEAGYKTEPWMVGKPITPKGYILVLSPKGYEKFSIHTPESFPKLLTHEINHRFMIELFNFKGPIWLFEGLAYCVAKQADEVYLDKQTVFYPFKKMHDTTFYLLETNTYLKAGCFVSHLLAKYGKDNIMQLIPEIANKDFEHASDTCKKICGKKLLELEQDWIQYLRDKYEKNPD